jgi:hypothetical protein
MQHTNTIEVANIARAFSGKGHYTFSVQLTDGEVFFRTLAVSKYTDEFLYGDQDSELWDEARDQIVRSIICDFTSSIIYK